MFFRQGQTSEELSSRRNGKSGAPSLLSDDVRVEGDIITEGDLHIGGSVKGRVVANKLTLGEEGTIAGIVEADSAIISGTLTGKLTATTVVLKRTANVAADITHVSLSIETGGTFEGFSRHVASIQPPTSGREAQPVTASASLSLTHAEPSPA